MAEIRMKIRDKDIHTDIWMREIGDTDKRTKKVKRVRIAMKEIIDRSLRYK